MFYLAWVDEHRKEGLTVLGLGKIREYDKYVDDSATRAREARERAERIASLASERRELEKLLDWPDQQKIVLEEPVHVRLATGRSVTGRLVVCADRISIESSERSGRWQFRKIGNVEVLP